MAGSGQAIVPAPARQVWAALFDPVVLRAIIPGAVSVERDGDHRFRAVLSFGVGRLKGHYRTELTMSDLDEPRSLTMAGTSVGWLGHGRASGCVTLAPRGAGTVVGWRYEGEVGGPVSLSGTAMLGGVSRVFVGRVFAALARRRYPASIGPSD